MGFPAPGALALQLSRLLGVAMATVPMGQRQVTPLALRATRALEDLNSQQVGRWDGRPRKMLVSWWLKLMNDGVMMVEWWVKHDFPDFQ